jgi:hypothetical protein
MTLASRRLVLVLAVCMSAVTLAACGDDTPPAGPSNLVDTPLVGTWQGPVGGTAGESILTLSLRADSTMSVDSDSPAYKHLDGVWTVSGTQLTATGDNGGGLTVTFLASVSRPLQRLSGTWSASNGTHGTFDTVKQ